MAQLMKLLVTIALTFAITTAIITTRTTRTNPKTETFAVKDLRSPGTVKIKPGRFLAQKDEGGQGPKARNPSATNRCNKDSEICRSTEANPRMACCNNKCMDLLTDKKNCGACNKKCKYTETCCGGQCANLNYNKRHCGECYHRCLPGGYCIYGLCNYA